MPEININVVMGQIIMTVKAIDWTEGNVGHVGVCLNGGSCRIDWGNGRTSTCCTSMYEKQPEWLGGMYVYPNSCKAAQERFDIVISSDSDNIVGIMADSGDMDVEDIDIIGSYALFLF